MARLSMTLRLTLGAREGGGVEKEEGRLPLGRVQMSPELLNWGDWAAGEMPDLLVFPPFDFLPTPPLGRWLLARESADAVR